MDVNQEKTVEVMYNACYGGFRLSKEAIKLYTEKCGSSWTMDRTDPIMIQIVKDLGEEASDSNSVIKFETIPEKYKRYFSIDEYDGDESIQIHYDAYLISKIKEIISNTDMNAETKVCEISNIIPI